MYARGRRFSGPQILDFFSGHLDDIEHYPWGVGGSPSRYVIFEDLPSALSAGTAARNHPRGQRHCGIAKRALQFVPGLSRHSGSDAAEYRESSKSLSNSGAGGRTRTDDLLITNQLLYQLSYAGLAWGGRRYSTRTSVASTQTAPSDRRPLRRVWTQSCRARFCNPLARVADDTDTAARNAAGGESSRIRCALRVQRRHRVLRPSALLRCDECGVSIRRRGHVPR